MYRVQSDCCKDIVVFFGKRDRRLGSIELRPDDVHSHPRIPCMQNGLLAVIVVSDKIHMRICVEVFHAEYNNVIASEDTTTAASFRRLMWSLYHQTERIIGMMM